MIEDKDLAALKRCVVYNPKTGKFFRIAGARPSAFGEITMHLRPNGYHYLFVDGTGFLAHRAAWFFMTGRWPGHEVDHRNRLRTDNRWANLRAASRSDQLANSRRPNVSGLRGAYPSGRRFYSQIVRGGKTVYLGTFDTAAEAHAAYVAAAKQVHGEFASDGSLPC